ncbi:MAG: TIGR04283 family arsenosugar biosynthesis glycosyltransferase [Pseudomonadales bacterium]
MQNLPACSIIIPVLNEAPLVPSQLGRLQSLRAGPHEIILVDGGSTDETVDLAQLLVDRVISSERGRSAQMNAGAAVASHPVLVFLHLDTQLPREFETEIQALQHSDYVWGFFPVRLDAAGRVFKLIAWAMNQRSRLSRVCTGDQVLCVKRAVFEQMGGFAPIALMEDVEICKRLRKISSPTVFSTPVLACGRKLQQEGVWRTITLMWYLRLAYFLGADPQRLNERYYD